MPRWLKVTLIVALVGGFVVFGSCSACAYWFKGATEDLKAEMEGAMEQARVAYEAGKTLGAGLDDPSICFDHAEAAFDDCGADPSAVMANGKCVNNAKMGARGCVQTAPRRDDMCEGIPRQLNFQMLMTAQQVACPKDSLPSCAMKFQTKVEICELIARQKEAAEAEAANGAAPTTGMNPTPPPSGVPPPSPQK